MFRVRNLVLTTVLVLVLVVLVLVLVVLVLVLLLLLLLLVHYYYLVDNVVVTLTLHWYRVQQCVRFAVLCWNKI